MLDSIQQKIAELRSRLTTISQYDVSSPCEDAYLIKPRDFRTQLYKPIGLTVMAVTHGDEVGN